MKPPMSIQSACLEMLAILNGHPNGNFPFEALTRIAVVFSRAGWSCMPPSGTAPLPHDVLMALRRTAMDQTHTWGRELDDLRAQLLDVSKLALAAEALDATQSMIAAAQMTQQAIDQLAEAGMADTPLAPPPGPEEKATPT